MQYGHFDNEKREYVIDRVDLPTSWTIRQADISSINLRNTIESHGFGGMPFRWTGRAITSM